MLQTIAPVAGPAALAYINAMITKQALFIAYLDDFKLMMIITFAVLPLLLFMKRGSKAGAAGRSMWRWIRLSASASRTCGPAHSRSEPHISEAGRGRGSSNSARDEK